MKNGFDRRQFLAGSTGALSLALTCRSCWRTPCRPPRPVRPPPGPPAVPPAPVARVEVVHDTYFGETLSDPYRWMENDKDPEWLPYLKAQNDHTRAVLDALPTRRRLLKRIQQLSGDTVATSRVQRAGGLIFFAQRPLGADNYKLFVREAARPRPRAGRSHPGGRRQRGPCVARLVARLAGRPPCGLRPVEGRQRGFDAARAHRRRRQDLLPSASPTPRPPIRNGSMTAAASSTTSSPARSAPPNAISTARHASTGSARDPEPIPCS